MRVNGEIQAENQHVGQNEHLSRGQETLFLMTGIVPELKKYINNQFTFNPLAAFPGEWHSLVFSAGFHD